VTLWHRLWKDHFPGSAHWKAQGGNLFSELGGRRGGGGEGGRGGRKRGEGKRDGERDVGGKKGDEGNLCGE